MVRSSHLVHSKKVTRSGTMDDRGRLKVVGSFPLYGSLPYNDSLSDSGRHEVVSGVSGSFAYPGTLVDYDSLWDDGASPVKWFVLRRLVHSCLVTHSAGMALSPWNGSLAPDVFIRSIGSFAQYDPLSLVGSFNLIGTLVRCDSLSRYDTDIHRGWFVPFTRSSRVR